MLSDFIEKARKDMFDIAANHGFVSPVTVEASQKLDYYLDLYQDKYLKYPYINGQEINVHGSIINNFNDALNRHKLAKNSSILLQDTQKWYPINEFQSLFASLEKQYDQQLLIDIGKNVPKNSIFPTDVDSFEKGLFDLNTAYKLNHRNGIDGYYKILFQDRREIIVICNTFFYPASFNMGIISGLAEKFNLPVRIEVLTNYKGGEFKVKLLSTF